VLDDLAERDGALHRVAVADQLVVQALLGQRLPAADDLGRIVHAQLVVLVLEQLWMRRLTWLSSIDSTMTL
jgi:hypothetical protein